MESLTSEARRDQLLMFGVMLTVAVGNTGVQSVLPAVGRMLKVPDAMVALSFTLSALIWSLSAPYWARRLGRTSAKTMVLIGLGGFLGSMLLCGGALTAGVRGWVSAGAAFAAFALGRVVYGSLGCASPPAAQALVVARTPRGERTVALSLLASAFGLGTILGPALAPFFVVEPLGLSGPLYVFALFGVGMIVLIDRKLPGLRLSELGRGVPATDPAIGFEPSDATVIAASAELSDAKVRFFDPRIRPWMLAGLVSGHAQALIGQTMAFLVIDRLGETPAQAQPLVGIVLMCGAGSALLAQWGLIPRLALKPPAMIRWGAILAALGAFGVALASGLHMLAIAYGVASLGFGFLRPGYTAGASLAVTEREQGVVAGHVTATNGSAFVLGPTIGILLYGAARPLPYLLCAALMAGLALYAADGLRPPRQSR